MYLTNAPVSQLLGFPELSTSHVGGRNLRSQGCLVISERSTSDVLLLNLAVHFLKLALQRVELVERIIAGLDQLGLTRSSSFVLQLIDQLGEVGLEVVPRLHLACLVTPILLEATRELAENGFLAVGSGSADSSV